MKRINGRVALVVALAAVVLLLAGGSARADIVSGCCQDAASTCHNTQVDADHPEYHPNCHEGQTCDDSTGLCGSGISCGDGLTDCGGTCVNTQSDPNNCGACGNVCPCGETMEVCVEGACSEECVPEGASCSLKGGAPLDPTGVFNTDACCESAACTILGIVPIPCNLAIVALPPVFTCTCSGPSPYYGSVSLNKPPSTMLAMLFGVGAVGLLWPTRQRKQ